MTFSALISFASLTFSHFVKQNLHTLKSCLQLLSHPWLKLNACLMQKCNTKIQHMLSAAERALKVICRPETNQKNMCKVTGTHSFTTLVGEGLVKESRIFSTPLELKDFLVFL